MQHMTAKYKYLPILMFLVGGLLLTACGESPPETEAPPIATETEVVEVMPEETQTLEPTEALLPTETSLPTATFTPAVSQTLEPTATSIVASAVLRDCNGVGGYSFEIPKTNYRFKSEGSVTQAYRIDDYVAVRVERKTNEAQDSLDEIMDYELGMIEIDMRDYLLGEVTELTLPAGEALTVEFSGALLVDESIVGELTVIALEDGGYLYLVGFGKFDGPNDIWDQEGRQMYTHILESLEIYPQIAGEDVCPTPESSN
ncbi:MAG: hypothetical protein JXB38_15800 [Anaerolineales bacterium]|nr:hypothetical protein [Anaerolineales bacterium]